MDTLIITAHPSSKGVTHQIAEVYSKAKGNCEVMNLYDPQWKQSFLAFENIREIPPCPVRDKIQKKISEAQELVFIFPLWWGFVPAILKNFFDMNLSAGFAFSYIKGKPVGLLTGKVARIFTTCDGPKWMYALLFFPFFIILKLMILRFCGIRVLSSTLFDKRFSRTEEEREGWMETVRNLAKKK